MMMKFTTLGVVHDEVKDTATKKDETSLSQTEKPKQHQKKRKGQRQNQNRVIKRKWSVKDSRKLLLMRLKVLMLNQNLRGDGVEFLIGKTSQSIQMN
jgi:hypothetical protein